MAETSANTKNTQLRTNAGAEGVFVAAYTTNPGDLGISAAEIGPGGGYHRTRITLVAVAQTITNGASEYTNTLLGTFPIGRIAFTGGLFSLTPTVTSVIATSTNSGSGTIGVGTAVASNATLATTMINVIPGTGQTPTAYTSPGTINTAGTTVTDALVTASTAQFDGTATAIKIYLNNSIATGSIDATMTWTGYIEYHWQFIGDY